MRSASATTATALDGLGAIVLAGLIVSCGSTVAPTEAAKSLTQTPTTVSPTDSQSQPIGTPVGSPSACPVTFGRPGTKPPQPFNPDDLPVGYVDTWYGNDAIWIRLPKDGTIPAHPEGGQVTISAKFPWWRVLPGQLQVSASRLGSGSRLKADVGTVAQYESTGFVPSGLVFDGPGCWEITGTLNGHTLSFVARVAVGST